MDTRKNDGRAQITKQAILQAAEQLFAKKGYDAVTMREIAKNAGCSHTTIYIYFQDKEALLHELSKPSLQQLQERLQQILNHSMLKQMEKLQKLSLTYIQFCLENKNMYTIFLNAKSSRVDEETPLLDINKLRIRIFSLLKQALGGCLSVTSEEQLLSFSRIYFYHLNGILLTYSYEHESVDVLMHRLTSTFNLATEVLVLGFQQKLNEEGN